MARTLWGKGVWRAGWMGSEERKAAGRRVRERWGTAGGREGAGVTELNGRDGWELESGKGRGEACASDGERREDEKTRV